MAIAGLHDILWGATDEGAAILYGDPTRLWLVLYTLKGNEFYEAEV